MDPEPKHGSQTLCFARSVPNTLEGISVLNAEVGVFLQSAGVSTEAIYAVETSVEEMLTNVVKYGYDDSAAHVIAVEIIVSRHDVKLILEDDGHPFDPTRQASPDMDRSIEDIPIGGLGIHLVRSLTESMEYNRENGRNRVIIRVPKGESGDSVPAE